MPVLLKSAQAGTLESSDALVSVAPGSAGSGIQLEIVSASLAQYGAHMRSLILEVCKGEGVTDAAVHINDKGAVDCVLEARVKTAIARALA